MPLEQNAQPITTIDTGLRPELPQTAPEIRDKRRPNVDRKYLLLRSEEKKGKTPEQLRLEHAQDISESDFMGYQRWAANQKAAKTLLVNELMKPDADRTQLHNQLQDYRIDFADGAFDLFSPDQLLEIEEKNPQAYEWFVAEQEQFVVDQALAGNQRAQEALQLLLDHDDISDEFRQMATGVIQLLDADTNKLQMISPAELPSGTITELEHELENTPVDEKTGHKLNEWLTILGFRDENGELKKGKIATFGVLLSLFVLGDQLIAAASGNAAIIPSLIEVTTSILGEIQHHEQLVKMKATNPDIYNYYAMNGMGENVVVSLMLDFAKNHFRNTTNSAQKM